MTQAEAVARVRLKLDDSAYPEATITQALNDYVNELYTKFKTKLMEKSSTLSVAQGDTTINLPTDYSSLLNLTVLDTSPYLITDKELEYNKFMRDYPAFATYAQAKPYYWTSFANKIRLAYPSNASYTINIDYLRLPVKTSSGSDSYEVPSESDEMVAQGGLVRAMEMNEEYAEAAQERSKLEDMETSFNLKYGRGPLRSGGTRIRTKLYKRGRNYDW